jgi:hypothetical protein
MVSSPMDWRSIAPTGRSAVLCWLCLDSVLILKLGQGRGERPLWVNLRHERFVPTGPLNPNLPLLQARPQAAAVRHLLTLTDDDKASLRA